MHNAVSILLLEFKSFIFHLYPASYSFQIPLRTLFLNQVVILSITRKKSFIDYFLRLN